MKLGLPFVPVAVREDYDAWPSLIQLFPKSFPGVKTSRDDSLVSICLQPLETRMAAYFDSTIPTSKLPKSLESLTRSTPRFNAKPVREELMNRGLNTGQFRRYLYRPFDLRWVYWNPTTKLLDEKRPEFFANVTSGNVFIEARQHQTQDEFSRGCVSRVLTDNFGNGLSNFFPLYLHDAEAISPTNPHPTSSLAKSPVDRVRTSRISRASIWRG